MFSFYNKFIEKLVKWLNPQTTINDLGKQLGQPSENDLVDLREQHLENMRNDHAGSKRIDDIIVRAMTGEL